MRYWVYINEKVEGPYEENDLVTVPGFTPETLICTEESASSGEQEWKKANTIFEFDEVPVNDPSQEVRPLEEQSVPVLPVTPVIDTAALLKKLDSISSEMSQLQSKLDSMQTHLGSALEQNKHLTEQAIQAVRNAEHQTAQAAPAAETEISQETPVETNYPAQAAPEEEEIIIRSALDSIYGGKLIEETPAIEDDTIQDLLPQKAAKSAEEIEQELEFIPLPEDSNTAPVQEPQVEKQEIKAPLDEFADLQPEVLVATPSEEEAGKDALINELTASPKEDVLDQIIQEHQQEEQAAEQVTDEPEVAEKKDLSVAAAALAAGGLAAAGAAAAAIFDKKEENPVAKEPIQDLSLEEVAQAEPLEIATDKDNPDQLEPVFPAEEMPQDVPAEEHPVEEPALAPADLPGLEDVSVSQAETPVTEEAPAAAPADLPGLDNADTPAEEPASAPADLPGLEDVSVSQAETPVTEEAPASAPADLPGLDSMGQAQEAAAPMETEPEQPWKEEDTIEELVPQEQVEELIVETVAPTADLEVADIPVAPIPHQATEQPEESAQSSDEQSGSEPEQAASEEVEHAAEIDSQESATQEENSSLVFNNTNLAAALASAGEENIAPTETMQASNPNDLTEIELKEGSTYLISDFVPPAQLTDNIAEVMNSRGSTQSEEGKKKEVPFQDMMATSTIPNTTSLVIGDLPADLAAASPAASAEDTIQAKRGASLDIKTIPMVPEPGEDRLDLTTDLNDVNAQHDLKTSGGMSKGTKIVAGSLVGLLVLVIGYCVLGLMHFLPNSINLFASKKAKQAVATSAQELLPPVEKPALPEEQPTLTPVKRAQEKVQQFPLPNGYSLKAFIESKHGAVAAEQIEWTSADAVEADNYSVSVKVPPENPQSLQTAYRFNYNMVTGMLNPTNSDAKNLLDQAYGKTQATKTSAKQTGAKQTGAKQTAKKGKTATTRPTTRR